MEKINILIAHLMAIANNAKDIHYNCGGDNFYGNHLFADRIHDGIDDFIDNIKETILLGHSIKPLHSSEYFNMAIKYIPASHDFKGIKNLILNTLDIIENIKDVSRGDNNILDDIAVKLQNDLGLINIMENK